MLRTLTLAFVCLTGQSATAQDIDCSKAMVQADLNQCAHDDWAKADARLNDAYQNAMALLEDWDAGLPTNERGGADALREAQRAWIVFRDKGCEAEGYAMKGGSAEPLVIYGCMRTVTLQRAVQLENLVADYVN
jgi:uncharacterized protein YecT (DUF1311 family)